MSALDKAIDRAKELLNEPHTNPLRRAELFSGSWLNYLLFLKEMREEEEKRFVASEYAESLEKKLEDIAGLMENRIGMPTGEMLKRIQEVLER